MPNIYIVDRNISDFQCDMTSICWSASNTSAGTLLLLLTTLPSIFAPLFLPSTSVSVSYFILAVPMRECFGNHSCASPQFPVAILTDTVFLKKRDDLLGWRVTCQKVTIIIFLFRSCSSYAQVLDTRLVHELLLFHRQNWNCSTLFCLGNVIYLNIIDSVLWQLR